MNDNKILTWSDQDSSSKENALSQFSDSVDSYTGLGKLLVVLIVILLILNPTLSKVRIQR